MILDTVRRQNALGYLFDRGLGDLGWTTCAEGVAAGALPLNSCGAASYAYDPNVPGSGTGYVAPPPPPDAAYLSTTASGQINPTNIPTIGTYLSQLAQGAMSPANASAIAVGGASVQDALDQITSAARDYASNYPDAARSQDIAGAVQTYTAQIQNFYAARAVRAGGAPVASAPTPVYAASGGDVVAGPAIVRDTIGVPVASTPTPPAHVVIGPGGGAVVLAPATANPIGDFFIQTTQPLAQSTGLSSTTLLLIGVGLIALFAMGRGGGK